MSSGEGAWRRRTCAAGVLILVAFACTAGLRPLLLPDEGRYVGIAWEMLRSGEWLTPTLDGLPFFHKPPLFYWVTAAALALFGTNEWAARAAPLLGAWIGTFGMYLFVRRWRDERTAVMTALVLVVQPLQYLGGQFANLDMLVAGFITATILLLAHAALQAERGVRARGALLAAYACAGLGVLAKGLIGALLPALVVATWLLLRRRGRDLAALASAPGMLVFAAIAAPWFLAMQLRFDGFLDYFIVEQHFRRYVASGFNNRQPFWFFPAVLLLLSAPWVPWVVRGLRQQTVVGARADPLRLLMLTWLVLVVLFFSLPQSKLVGYVLPAVPPLAFLVATIGGEAAVGSRRAWYASVAASAAVCLATVGYFATHDVHSSRAVAYRLRAERLPGEPVFMLARYDYDLAFYAHLHAAVGVVDDWSDPAARNADNWRRELLESADFLPAAALRRLIPRERLPALLCAAPASWIVGSPADAKAFPFLASAEVVWSRRDVQLWRVRRGAALDGALPCAEGVDATSAAR